MVVLLAKIRAGGRNNALAARATAYLNLVQLKSLPPKKWLQPFLLDWERRAHSIVFRFGFAIFIFLPSSKFPQISSSRRTKVVGRLWRRDEAQSAFEIRG